MTRNKSQEAAATWKGKDRPRGATGEEPTEFGY